MGRPRSITSGEAMRWNEDVNRRRLAHHERRCAEDAMYRKAYEYQQAEKKKFIGNAVEVNMSRVLCEALARKLMDKVA